MLRPQDNIVRETKSLDGLWDFALDAMASGVGGWWQACSPAIAARRRRRTTCGGAGAARTDLRNTGADVSLERVSAAAGRGDVRLRARREALVIGEGR